MRRYFLLALSFVNLCYLRVWTEVLTYSRADTFMMLTPPKPFVYWALMANVLLGAGVLSGLSLLANRLLTGRNSRFPEMAVVLGLCIPINAIRSVLANQYPFLKSPLIALLGQRGVIALGLVIAVCALVAIFVFHRILSRAAILVIWVLVPFCLVTFGQAVWRATHYDGSAFANNPPAPMLAGAKKLPRVVWFIADEWDYRLTFVDRPPSLALPELDRLRKEAIFTENAHPPGQETKISIPGYYTGRLVAEVRFDGPWESHMWYRGESVESPWNAQPNVFQHARELGVNTALVDWFQPTCRILTGLSFCSWLPMAIQYNSMGDTFGEVLLHQPRSLFETNLFSLFGRALSADQQTGVYHAIVGEAEQLIGDTNFGFTLVHLPIPHAPHAYNRKTGEFTLGNSPIGGYVDSLALLDRTVGEVRQTMERAGTWDSTTVLFTSDHHYRQDAALDGKTDPRIPYLLKLAGQKVGTVYAQPFNTVLTGELLLAVMRGEVSDAAGAVSWIDRNRTKFPVE